MATTNIRPDDQVGICDIRRRFVSPVRRVGAAGVEATLGGWTVQSQVRPSSGIPMLCVCIINPYGEITDLAVEVLPGVTNCSSLVATQLSPDVALIFRNDTSDADADRCTNALRRVVAAAHAVSHELSRDVARLTVECAALDVDPERVQTFRDEYVEAMAQFGITRTFYLQMSTDVVVAFQDAGWTPQRVALFYRHSVPIAAVRVSATWIRSTTTRTVTAAAMLDWAPDQTLLFIESSDMNLARRYRAAGWTFQQMKEITILCATVYPRYRITKAWYHVPPVMALSAAKAGLSATEARAMLTRRELNEDSIAVLAALRAR